MADVYVARMWLSCDSQDDAVLEEFETRWTQSVEREWSVLAFDGSMSETTLKSKLDEVIKDEYETTIKNDIDPQHPVSSLSWRGAFAGNTWHVGNGGQHESTVDVLMNVAGQSEPANWSFEHNGQRYDVRAHVRWKRVTIKT